MKIKELLAKHGVENAELLSDIESAIDSSDMIPKSRFNSVIKERNTLRADVAEKDSVIETLKTEKETLKTQTEELTGFKTKWESQQEARNNEILSNWEEKAKIFAIDETDKRFETVNNLKESFVFAEEGKKLSPEQANSNLEKYNLLEKAGALVLDDGTNYDKGKGGKKKSERKDIQNPYNSMYTNKD
jgi:hypothetical protein